MSHVPKRRCVAVLEPAQTLSALHLHHTDIYICGLPECRSHHPQDRTVLTPYVPMCGAHRALAQAVAVPVFVDESIAEFRL